MNIWEIIHQRRNEMRNCLLLSKENCKLIKRSIKKLKLFKSVENVWYHPAQNKLYSAPSGRGGHLPNWSASSRKQNVSFSFQMRFTLFVPLQCRIFSWKLYNDNEIDIENGSFLHCRVNGTFRVRINLSRLKLESHDVRASKRTSAKSLQAAVVVRWKPALERKKLIDRS